MRFTSVLLALLPRACASYDSPILDTRGGGVPFVIVRAGFFNGVEVRSTGIPPKTSLQFVFTNVSRRAQTIDHLTVHQRESGTTRFTIEPATIKVNRMIDSGADVEIEIPVLVRLGGTLDRDGRSRAVELDAYLVLGDGTKYFYPIGIRTGM